MNNRKQRVYSLSYCLKQLPHPAVFTSNVQRVRLATGRRTLKMCCYHRRINSIICLWLLQKSSCSQW